MSELIDYQNCWTCACCHFTSPEKDTLFCVKMQMNPRLLLHSCNEFEPQKCSPKLVLTPEFLKVLKMLSIE